MKAFAECDVLFLNTWELLEQLQSQAYAVQLAQESRGGLNAFVQGHIKLDIFQGVFLML